MLFFYVILWKIVQMQILMQVRLHHGLALFNLQQFEQASIILHKICEDTHEPRMQMYALLSDIRSECTVYYRGESGDADSLAALLSQLQNHKGSYYYQAQELLVALVTLEASYLLGLSEKHYLEQAINEYNQLSQSVKDNAYVKFSYAHCLEINGSRDLATEIYRSLPWKSDAAVAERYMICLVLNGTPEQAIKIYCELENVAKTIQTQTTYLLALSRNESVSYLDELRSAISNYTDCLSALSQIAYYVESKAVADEIMTPTLKNSLSPSALSEIAFQNKMELLIYFSKYREIALLEKVLDSIESLDLINSFAVTQIYQALFEIVQQDPLRIASIHSEDSPISLIEHIADRFLQENVSKKYFLQIRILCASAKKAHFSMLRYSKELFEITHDLQTARNIVALLFERKDNRPESYLPYLSVLESSDVPAHCMAVSSAKLILGLDEEAERYAYKALYLLNGRDDFDVFKSFLGFCSYKLHRLSEEDTMYSVKRNSVVLLEEYNAADEGNRIMICLDSESQFADASNRSMDVEHLTSSSPDYIRLIGSGLNQMLNFRGKKYKITQIMSRQQYALGYIFRKISKHPEEFEGAIHTISTENPEEMIDRIKALTDTSKRTKELIDTYHFGNSQFGLPIELVASGDYDRYIGVLRYLLYQPNEALYAGMYKYEDETGQRYVPTLSTLALLSILGQLEILTPCQPDMIIPESYHLFFREKFAKAAELAKSGASTLFFVDGKPVMQESDKSIPDIWGAIIEFCNGCETKEVCDEERIAFRLFNEMSGEELLAGFKLDVIQLDALILAKRENATYLCDDLFFRKVAEGLRIRNLNFVSLLQHYNDINYIVPILMEMSTTNYIYLPLWARDSGEQNVLITNLLNGERKQMYYGSMLKAYFDEFEKMARELFGDDIVDQAKEKAKVKLIEQSSKLEK